jgi:hypothetical protein
VFPLKRHWIIDVMKEEEEKRSEKLGWIFLQAIRSHRLLFSYVRLSNVGVVWR